MIEWLQKFGGYTSTGLTIDEKKELESLRLEVKKYRAMEEGIKDAKEEKKEGEDEEKSQSESESDDDEDVDPELDNIVEKINQNPDKKKMSLAPRSGVSAEAYGIGNKKDILFPKTIPKAE